MKFVVLIFHLLAFFSLDALSQSKPTTTPQKVQKAQENSVTENSLNLRIIAVLHQTADEAKGWDDVKISSQIQAQIADLLWDFDAVSAENYLTRAWDKARQVKESKEKPSRFRNYSDRVDAGREVLLVARKRQPQLAKKWLKELSDSAQEDFEKKSKGLFDDRTARSAVLLQMAMQAAETDIQAAASLATESLRDGISFGLQSVLIKIQEKNAELAAQVFRAAMKRINSVGVKDAGEIQILYSYLYTPGRVSTTADSASQGNTITAFGRDHSNVTSAAGLYPDLAREFVQIAAHALLKMPFLADAENPQTSAREQFGVINSILYRLGNSSPELSRALHERLNEITANAGFSPAAPISPKDLPPRQQGESRSDFEKRLLDKALEEAEKIANPLQRDVFIAQTVLRSDAGQFEKVKNAAEKIDDKELREQILNFLLYKASLNLIKVNNLDEAYKLLQKNSEPRQKAAILIVGGQTLIKQKDFIQAQNWLYDAQKLFDKHKSSNEDWINIGFGLVNGYALFDEIEALKILRTTVKLIEENSKNYNRDKAPLAVKFSGLDFSDFTFGTKNFGLNSAIKSFSKQSFEDVLSALKDLKNPQAKGEGILLLSRKNLEKNVLTKE